MAGEVKRASRVAEGIREELSLLLTTRVRDPRLSGVLVSRVALTDDLRSARVYFRLLEGGDGDRIEAAKTGLSKAAGLLRKELGAKLKLRVVPELRFTYDEGQEARDRIDALLEEVRRERKPGE
ncbi:MAG: 30S ribosome-binding factor RbfA [Myxococcales bacterium]|jgi:ribosome-binding factor A|nr:30S ribosome-binding factor RbfA [Myxococcales bacterium]